MYDGKAIKKVELGNAFKEVLEQYGATPQDLGFSKNHLTKSVLGWLAQNNVANVRSETTDSVIVKLNGEPEVVQVMEKAVGVKKRFTIERKGRPSYEMTVVGKTGQIYAYQGVNAKGEDGHFTDEGKYRRAIAKAVSSNKAK